MIYLEDLEREGVSAEEEALLPEISNLVKMTKVLKDSGISEVQSMIKLELQTKRRASILRRLVQSLNSKLSDENHEELTQWLTKNR